MKEGRKLSRIKKERKRKEKKEKKKSASRSEIGTYLGW